MGLRQRLLVVFLVFSVLPIAVISALAALGGLRLVAKRAEGELAGRLETLSRLIDREVRAERVHLMSLAAEMMDPGGSQGSEELADWLLHNGQVVRSFDREPHLVSMMILLDPAGGRAFAIEGSFVSPPGRMVIRGIWDPPPSLTAPYRHWLAGEDPDVVRGEAGLTAAGHEFVHGRGGLLSVPRPTGATLAVAVRFPLHGAGAPQSEGVLPHQGAGAPMVLVEELDVMTLLERIAGQAAFEDLESCFVAASEGRGGGWRFLYHSDPSLIGLPFEAGSDTGALAGLGVEKGSGGASASSTDEAGGPDAVSLVGDRRGDREPRWSFSRSADRLVAAGQQPSTGWRLGGAVSLGPYRAPFRSGLGFSAALLATMALLVTGGIILVTRGIGGAVEEIAAGAGAIARGDLDRTVAIRRTDEFGTIASHINQMARELVITAESRSIARLSSRLVHDLKGVASQMNLLLYNLKENYDDAEFRAEFAGLMKGLVNQVESLALRLRRGGAEGEPRWENVDLDGLVRRIVERHVRAARPEIEVVLEAGAPGGVVADVELLTETIDNVVANAVEAMSGNGRLRASTGSVEMRRTAGGPTHFLEIEDAGRGMSRQFIENDLFRPFTTTKEKGIGLGMYQVRRALDAMGGRIFVTSREGVGTVVRIEVGRNAA